MPAAALRSLIVGSRKLRQQHNCRFRRQILRRSKKHDSTILRMQLLSRNPLNSGERSIGPRDERQCSNRRRRSAYGPVRVPMTVDSGLGHDPPHALQKDEDNRAKGFSDQPVSMQP
jgi:hypothetical protein